jgi:hypothetical protein
MLPPPLHMNEPVNAAAFLSNERDAATSLHMSEPVNAAAFLSDERDSATSLHMSELVNAATFSCPPCTFRTLSSSFQAFCTLLIRRLPFLPPLTRLPMHVRSRLVSVSHLPHTFCYNRCYFACPRPPLYVWSRLSTL